MVIANTQIKANFSEKKHYVEINMNMTQNYTLTYTTFLGWLNYVIIAYILCGIIFFKQ